MLRTRLVVSFLTVFVMMIAVLASTANADLITNGSFEDPDLGTSPKGYTAPTGWQWSGDWCHHINTDYPVEPPTRSITAKDGHQVVALYAESDYRSMRNSSGISGIEANKEYIVTVNALNPWWLPAENNSKFRLQVSWDNGNVELRTDYDLVDDNQDWHAYTFVLDTHAGENGAGAVGRSDIGVEILAYKGSSDMFFDAISLKVVPEPSTVVMLCMGALGLLAYAWRRRKS